MPPRHGAATVTIIFARLMLLNYAFFFLFSEKDALQRGAARCLFYTILFRATRATPLPDKTVCRADAPRLMPRCLMR